MNSARGNPSARRRPHPVVLALYAACGALLVVEFAIHKHPHFSFEGLPFFYAAFGFLAYGSIVLSAKALRPLLRRDEDYYDGDAEDAEDPPPVGEEGRDG